MSSWSAPRRAACLLALSCAPVVAGAQAAPPPASPLALARAVTRAVVADSVEPVTAAWRATAVGAPSAPAPRLGLALLARATHDAAGARAWLDSAARVAAGDPRWRAAVAREGSAAALLRGDYAEAVLLARRALADTAALPADERAWTRFQDLVARRRRGERVTTAMLDSIDRITPRSDTLLLARLACVRIGREPARVAALADSGVALALAVGDPQSAATCRMQLGAWLTDRGDPPAAVRAFRAADTLFAQARDIAGRAAANQRLGYVLLETGDVRGARERLSLALVDAARTGDAAVHAWALMNVAQTELLVGDRAAATASLDRAISLHRQTGDRPGLVIAEGFLAQLRLDLGQHDEAARLYAAQRAAFEAQGDGPRVLIALAAQANVAMHRGRRDEARALLDTLEQRAGSAIEAWDASLPAMRGRLALADGDAAGARRLLREARARFGEGQALFRHEIDLQLALAALQLGDTTEALATLARADSLLDRFRATLTVGALRSVSGGRVASWGGPPDEGDRVLAALVTTRHRAAVFEATERTRARALTNAVVGASDDSTMLAATRIAPRTLAAVQARLPRSTALLVYGGGAGGAPTTLLVVTRAATRGVALAPLRELEPLVERWNALLEAGDAGLGAGRALAAAILAPALAGLPSSVTHLVVVPQGALHRVPFAALPTGRALLGDRATTTMAPSVALALRTLEAPAAGAARVLAVGAGDAAQPDAAPGTIAPQRGGASLAALPAADDEARLAAAWAPGSRALVGAAATEGALKATRSDDWTVLHAAAHALASDQALGASWLILRPDSSDDGYVSGGELAALARGRALVVLSGCRTTGDFSSRGDAIDGLVAPLLAAGVRTVVASHWAVSDRATRDLMARFYEALGAGATVADALASAQRAMRRAGASPRAWAAFTVIGDGSLRFAAAGPRGDR